MQEGGPDRQLSRQPADFRGATFSYDGDGKRVKSTINSVSTLFVGNYYKKTGSTITKYYYAPPPPSAPPPNATLKRLNY